VLYLSVGEPVLLVVIGGTAQGLMLPFLGWAALRGFRQVPPELRAGRGWTVWLVASFAAMDLLGLYQAGDKTGLWKAVGLFQKK
jgi:hypothetical protein